MLNAKLSGGLSHIRYDHYRYPRLVDVICSYCSSPATLIHINAPQETQHFLDIDYKGKTWNFSCNKCLKQSEMEWEETKNFKLTYTIAIRGEAIWAWNRNHLDYLIRIFSGEDVSKHEWNYFKTYINKKWFTKTKNSADINKLKILFKAGNSES